jgi:S1-C subfamily serine protease
VLDREGYVLTNAHVVEGARDVRIRLQEGALVAARLIGADVSNDLTLVKVDPGAAELVPLPLADERVADAVELTYVRAGERRTVQVELAARPS